MRILVLGDTHGNRGQINYVHQIMKSNNLDTVVQVGDFGYGWPREYGEHEDFIDFVSQRAVQNQTHWYWLDGNHEGFTKLIEDEPEIDITSADPQPMRPNVTYLPRGCTWEWDGVKFMAMGGAVSVDKQFRTEGKSWWPEEAITQTDVDRAVTRGHVDVMFTHDAPEGACPLVGSHSSIQAIGYKADQESRTNRLELQKVIDAVTPHLLIHGHMHYRYATSMYTTTDPHAQYEVQGIACDGDGRDSWVIYNTETRKIEDRT